MATAFNFNGQLIELPGVNSQIKSGVNNPPANLSYGNILVLDVDPMNQFGGGSGILGTINSNDPKKNVYRFDNVKSFREFIRGGKYWDLAGPLFKPFGTSTGISQIIYVRPVQTIAASAAINFVSGGNGGVLLLKTRHEGHVGNTWYANESRAFGTATITSIGTPGDTPDFQVDGVTIGSATVVVGMTEAELAVAFTDAINADTSTQWTATVSGATVTVYAPPGSGATTNTQVVMISGTWAGTATYIDISSGGITGVNTISRGFGYIVEVSPTDSTKWVMKFYRGSFTGLDSDQTTFSETPSPYDGIKENESVQQLVATSDDFSTYQELYDWMISDFDFNNNFQLDISNSSQTGTGAFITGAFGTALGSTQPFSGGNQTYSPADLALAFENIAEEDYTFVFAPDGKTKHSSAINTAILTHLQSQARFEKFMIIGAGDIRSEFTTVSIPAAVSYNSDKVIVVHGGVEIPDVSTGVGRRSKTAQYKAAAVLGRTGGLAPQTPITFKGLSYSAEKHNLSKSERKQGLKNGLLLTFFDGDIGAFTILQGVNTLQKNKNLINADGTSHSIQLKRITSQLNKEIEVNAKKDLLGNQNVGPNRNTISPEVVTEWLKGFLQLRTATTTIDNLILGFQDISVTIVQDAYQINYAVIPNFEVNKLFFTGLIIDPNL